jgi:hypothetical protein
MGSTPLKFLIRRLGMSVVQFLSCAVWLEFSEMPGRSHLFPDSLTKCQRLSPSPRFPACQTNHHKTIGHARIGWLGKSGRIFALKRAPVFGAPINLKKLFQPRMDTNLQSLAKPRSHLPGAVLKNYFHPRLT